VVFLLAAGIAGASPAHERSSAGGAAGGDAGRAAIQRALGSNPVDAFVSSMDADRMLLFEVRKDLPQTRAEANVYLQRLKDLAGKSDAARLVPKVNRMLEQAPIYYDWVEKNIQNQNENANEYVVGGARGFLVAFQEFQAEVLLVVINRLELAGNAIRNVEALPSG
jgi:hypothetical protein